MDIIARKDALRLGFKRYFTGKPCLNGHVCERKSSDGACIGCLPALNKASRERHPDNKKMQWTSWYQRNADKHRSNSREYRSANLEVVKSRAAECRRARAEEKRAIRERNKEALERDKLERKRASLRKYYSNNREACMERNRAQRLAKPDLYKATCQRRRARKAGATGSHSAADVAEIRKMQRGKCAICRVSLNRAKERIDHIMPLALGGSNDRANIQILCEPCNLQKWAHHPIDHARMRGLLL